VAVPSDWRTMAGTRRAERSTPNGAAAGRPRWWRRQAEHAAAPPRTLLDPDLQARFEQDGYVVVDLLDHEALGRLRSGYERLEHAHDRESPFAAGFNTTLYDTRPAHRREVLAVLDDTVGRAIGAVLDDHRLYVANFAVKLPHSASVPFHLDWSFVDERYFTSVGVWCALYDTGARNGTLGMVRGSHRAVDRVRPVNDRAYERYEDNASGAPDEVLLPLRAGQAIVYDSRTVHFSPPNDTDRERVAAACGAAPAGAPLYHYWVGPDDRLVRYEVSRDFYLTYTVGSPPHEADGVLGAEPLPSPKIRP
jgi:hypothetical protein